MSSLVKLPPKYKYLGIPSGSSLVRATADQMGAHLPAFKGTLLSGPKAGSEVTEVRLNQVVKLVPEIPVKTSKYTVLLGFNPKLGELGTVNCTSILAPGEDISLTIKAYKNFNLDELDYIFTIYLLD